MMTYEIRPMTVGEIMENAFEIFRGNFLAIMKPYLIAVVPLHVFNAVLWGGLSLWFQISPQAQQWIQDLNRMPPEEAERWFFALIQNPWAWLAVGALIVYLIVFTLLSMVATLGATHTVGCCYLQRKVPMGELLGVGFRLLFPFFILSLVMGLALFFGALACLIPGIYLMLRWFVASPALVLNNREPVDAMSESWELTGMPNQTVNAFLLFLISIAVGFATGIVSCFCPLPILNQVVQSLLALVAQAFGLCMGVVFYLSLRAEAEGYHLARFAQEFGGMAPQEAEAYARSVAVAAPVWGPGTYIYPQPGESGYDAAPYGQAPPTPAPYRESRWDYLDPLSQPPQTPSQAPPAPPEGGFAAPYGPPPPPAPPEPLPYENRLPAPGGSPPENRNDVEEGDGEPWKTPPPPPPPVT
ncbi:MAG: hypothetical protein RLY93_20775 [Sumerlaeia bacterium]